METNTKFIAVVAGAFILGGLVVIAVEPRLGGDHGYARGDREGNERGMMGAYDDKRSKETVNTNQSGMMGGHMMSDGTMMGGEMNGMGMMVANEREFIEGMIPHHAEAVVPLKK